MKLDEKRDIKPLLVKFGVAFVFSLAGFFFSRHRTKKTKPALPPCSPCPSDGNNGVQLGARGQVKDDVHTLKSVPSSCYAVSVPAQRCEESYKQQVTVENPGNSPKKKDVEALKAGAEPLRAFRSLEKDDYEQEIKNLKNKVRMLQERERNLEVQLIEYYGLKEQETVVMELQNRLKVKNMETKLLNLKIESLQADNQKLEAQTADQPKMLAELEAARSKIKLLKKKLRSEAEHNREQILGLQKRVTKLQEQENKVATSEQDTQSRLQRLKDLEGEADDLRTSNMKLQLENSELARRLESTQMLAMSVKEDSETKVLKEMSQHLREENESLTKKIEQLQADKCTGVEELVYLKWINACLRYELRNYQVPAGKTIARDLSKTLSLESEEKAKQLILEYANTEVLGTMMDIDSDQWSSSQASYITDSENPDDSSVDKSSATKTNTSSKAKFFHKLRKLIQGKDVSPHKQGSSGDKMLSFEDNDSPQNSSNASTETNTFSEVSSKRIPNLSLSLPRNSLDIQRLRNTKKEVKKNRRNSDSASHHGYKKYNSRSKSVGDLENQSDQHADLLKFAEALKISHGSKKGKLRRDSASFTFG